MPAIASKKPETFTLAKDKILGDLIVFDESKTSFNDFFITGPQYMRPFDNIHRSVLSSSTDFDLALGLLEERQTDRERIEALEQQVAELQEVVGLNQIEPRAVSEVQAKDEVRSYFTEHHGETVYPSDVAVSLRLEYSLVSRLITELETDGEIQKT